MDFEIIFETERLFVRQIVVKDFDCLFEICSDNELMRYVGEGIPLSEEQTKKWIQITIQNYETKGFGNYAVINKKDNNFVGYCGLVFSKESNEIELIYALKKEYWRKGLATEVAKSMINFGFINKNLPRIFASIDPKNISSEVILKKLGFEFTYKKNDEFGFSTYYYCTSKN